MTNFLRNTVVGLVVGCIATAALAGDAVGIRLKDGSRWRGQVSDQVEVTVREQGIEIQLRGRLVVAAEWFITLETDLAGELRRKTIFKGDILSITTIDAPEANYRFETIDPSDRREIVRISGQPFTPVAVHGDTVMFDSGAILRYLEANFPDTPKLFSDDYGTMRQIEQWEAFSRTTLHEPLMIMVRQRIAGVSDDTETARATELFAAATAELEAVLADNEWLAHTRMTAADVTGAAVIRRVQEMAPFDLPADRLVSWKLARA